MKRAAIALGAAAILATGFSISALAETRTLKLYNTHTKERVSITFKKNGRYLSGGLREANRFLRDWRRNEITKIDPELLDLVWEVYRKVGARDYIHVVSSYRSPATNNMLRKRSSGVARNSQHTLGKAMDFYIPGVKVSKLRAAGLRKQVGGVGYYPRSGSPFVHLDTGSVRHWPKMSRSQLARVFPNGKTLHIPSDGKPMKGYKVALAEAKSGNRRKSRPTIVASRDTSTSRPANTRNQSLTNSREDTTTSGREAPEGGNLFARLFGGAGDNQETATRPGAIGNQPARAVASAPSPIVDNPPVPVKKFIDVPDEPTTPIVVASAAPTLKPETELSATAAVVASASPPPAPNTLDAQRQTLETGGPAAASQPLDARFQIARAPAEKPTPSLSAAAQEAAAELGLSTTATPRAAPAGDAVAAIAAATGTAPPSPAPAPRPETTLAYASPTATPPALERSLRPSVSPDTPQAARPSRAVEENRNRPATASVSGRIPKDQIVDPLAGFASLPDKSEPALLSGTGTTRHQDFAWLSHPNQRQMENVMLPGNRFVSASFERRPYGNLRTDRFDGPAIVVLPIRYAR
ncbi:DUF882 domain-containing protein [Roseibium denhamense]|nr:DUF882 domain-containing protein [Roseibium denhamense]MTI06822.1 DUF882 domain-containing protein [Roseibium denhamense]